MMVLFILDDVFENGEGAFVAEFLELSAIFGYIAAFFDFQAPQRHADASSAIGERVSFAARRTLVDRFGAAEFDDATFPESRMFPLSGCEVTQDLRANRLCVPIGKGVIGVIALHFGLPVSLEGSKNFLQFSAAQRARSHEALLLFLEDKAFWSVNGYVRAAVEIARTHSIVIRKRMLQKRFLPDLLRHFPNPGFYV